MVAARCGDDLGGERGGVGRDDELVVRRSAQRQARHALRRVLIGEGVVAAGVRRFRDAPRHVVLARERDLLEHGGVRGAVQDAAVRLVEDERRHQVLEHRSRPRAQAGERADGVERPAERDPVRRGNVALGDRPQAGRARFRGEQVVEAAVELVLGDAKADVEQAPLAVEEEGEVGLGGDRAAGRRDALEPGRDGVVAEAAGRVAQRRAQGRQVVLDRPGEPVRGRRHRLVERQAARSRRARRRRASSSAWKRAGSAVDSLERRGAAEHVGERFAAERRAARGAQQGDPRRRGGERAPQGAWSPAARGSSARHAWASASRWRAEVAAVDGGDVLRRQRLGRAGCRTSSGSGRDGAAAAPGVASVASTRSIISTRADPAEALRARGGQQVQADVGRRGAVRDHVARHDLQVVGRQVVVLGADDALEQAPGVARDVVEVGRGRRARARRRAAPAAAGSPTRSSSGDSGPDARRAASPTRGRTCPAAISASHSTAAATGAPQCLRTRTRRSVVAAASAAAAVVHSSRWRWLTNWR